MTITSNILHNEQDELLSALGIKTTDATERQAIASELVDHFQELILETVIQNLTDDQAINFRKGLTSKDPESAIADIAAGVPGLAQKIDQAVEAELAVVRSAYQSLN
jgi:hypothetical protein